MRCAGVTALVVLVTLGLALATAVTAQRPADGLVPKFKVDPFWPKPLPNRWLLGQVSGVAVDARDHVWIVQRPRTLTEDERGATLTPPRSVCCVQAPPVMEFDAEGTLVQAWLAGNGEKDHQVLKFTRDRGFVMQIGKPGASRGDGDATDAPGRGRGWISRNTPTCATRGRPISVSLTTTVRSES